MSQSLRFCYVIECSTFQFQSREAYMLISSHTIYWTLSHAIFSQDSLFFPETEQ